MMPTRRQAAAARRTGVLNPLSQDRTEQPLSMPEFIALAALMISLVALSIDAMLPAMAEIGSDLDVARENDIQFIVSSLFLGLACSQILFGPLSDSIGRKAAIFAGFAVFAAGSTLSAVAQDLPTMLAGRFLQGIGAAGPRIVTMAVIRDLYEGRVMARIMSMVMGVFILVPALAPLLGQAILLVGHWRWIFVAFLVLSLIVSLWLGLRLRETLPAERRRPFSAAVIFGGMVETVRNRSAFGYTLSGGIVFGAFVGYIAQAPQILQIQYGLGNLFAVYFAVLALSVGAASFVNSALVIRYGMRRLSLTALIVLCAVSIPFAIYARASGADLPLNALLVYLGIVFFCFGVLFGNFSALALEHLGHIAGIGAAVVGSLTTFIALGFGGTIAALYDGTAFPLCAGFAVLGVLSLIIMWSIERGR